MKAVHPAILREAERTAFANGWADPEMLMKNAGAAVARYTAEMARTADLSGCGIMLLCGTGNNGGDGFHAAVCLQADGFQPIIFLAGDRENLSPEAAACLARAERKNILVIPVKAETPFLPPPLPIAVDALLGTGFSGNLRGSIRRCVEYLAQEQSRLLIVAADVPTGLDAETGAVPEDGLLVQADLTIAMAYPKTGMLSVEGPQACGSIRVENIGLPEETQQMILSNDGMAMMPNIITASAMTPYHARRETTSHKGTFGRALLLAGSAQYPGAAVLATAAACRSGVGITHLRTVPEACTAALCHAPAAIIETTLHTFGEESVADALLIGPGLGITDATRALVLHILQSATCPVILDADALNVLKVEELQEVDVPLVLTPHPGELARLLQENVADIQKDRRAAAETAAGLTGATVVLKGAGTLVAHSTYPTHINLTGNPGMACGGSGDVLAGLLAGFLAQTPGHPFEAACAATYLHGIAGDRAAWRRTPSAMNAADIVDAIA